MQRMRWIGVGLLVAVACSDKRSPPPAPAPAPSLAKKAEVAPPAPVIKPGRYYVRMDACDAAIAIFVGLPATGDLKLGPREVDKIGSQLELPGAAYRCDTGKLANVVRIAMGFLEDTRVVIDYRGGDGPLFLLRHLAKGILEGLTGQRFGEFHTVSVGYTRHGGGQFESPENPDALPRWKAWWADASTMKKLTEQWERERDELAVKAYAPAVAQLRGKKLHASRVYKVMPFKAGVTSNDLWDYEWMFRDGKLVRATQAAPGSNDVVIEPVTIVDHIGEANPPATAVLRWRYGAEVPFAELATKNLPIPDRLIADVEAQEPEMFQILLRENFLSLFAVDGDSVAQLMLQ